MGKLPCRAIHVPEKARSASKSFAGLLEGRRIPKGRALWSRSQARNSPKIRPRQAKRKTRKAYSIRAKAIEKDLARPDSAFAAQAANSGGTSPEGRLGRCAANRPPRTNGTGTPPDGQNDQNQNIIAALRLLYHDEAKRNDIRKSCFAVAPPRASKTTEIKIYSKRMK